MGNEQSASGEGEGESGSNGCQQQATTSASVANGDEHSFLVVVADSWTTNDPLADADGSSSTPSACGASKAIRSHSAAPARTPSLSASSRPVANRGTVSSPFNTRSLRIRTHHQPPTRCASAMDNVSATASHQARTNSAANFTPSSARSPRPAQVCRQRSAVSFASSGSGTLASGTNSSSNMTASATSGSSSTDTPSSEKAPPLASLLGLSSYQQQQIVQSWPRLQQSGGHTAGAEIFRKLTFKCPPIKETFQKADVVERLARARGYDIYKEHGRLLFEVFQTAVSSLNDSADEVSELCRGYGARHLSLRGEGFQTRMWDDLAELLVEHVTRLDTVRRHREVMRAWTALIMFLVEKMKEGYDFGLRKSSQPALTSPFAHRAFPSSFGDEDLDQARRRETDGADYSGPPTSARRDRKMSSLRREDTQQETERDDI